MQGSRMPAKARKKALFLVKTIKTALDKSAFSSMVKILHHECLEDLITVKT